MKKYFFCWVLSFAAGQANAQTTGGIMPTINFSKGLKKTNALNLYVYDIFAGGKNIDFNNKELYSELAFIQMLNTHYGITLAYAHQINNAGQKNKISENRFFQEFFREDKIGKNFYKNRLRVEERFFNFKADNSNAYQTRIRYLFYYKHSGKKGFFNTYNDLFYVPNAIKVFAENWLYAGYAINLSKNTSLEFGALWQNFALAAGRGNQFLFQPTLNKKF